MALTWAAVKGGRVRLDTVAARLRDAAVLAFEAGLDAHGYRLARVAVQIVSNEVSLNVMRRRAAAVRAARKRANVGSGGGSGGDDAAGRAVAPTAAASGAGDVAETPSAIPPQTRED